MSENDIKFFTPQIQMLDEVYKQASVTAVLDGNNELARMTEYGNEFQIPTYDMEGFGNYSRTTGYPKGAVTMGFETKKPNIDRARVFQVEKMDNIESAGIAFGSLSAQFVRTKAVPEIDAIRLSTYYGKAPTEAKKLATLSGGEDWIKALSTASVYMDNKEVPTENRYLFITSDGLAAINDLDTTKSRAALARFAGVQIVPQTRFYSAIKLLSGSGDETAGGYTKASGAVDINFEIIHPSALIQYTKDIVNKVINPDENQEGDWWKFFYHMYGIAEVYDNKVDGIYCHAKAAA